MFVLFGPTTACATRTLGKAVSRGGDIPTESYRRYAAKCTIDGKCANGISRCFFLDEKHISGIRSGQLEAARGSSLTFRQINTRRLELRSSNAYGDHDPKASTEIQLLVVGGFTACVAAHHRTEMN